MKSCVIIILIILLSQVNGSGQSYGLAFNSHETALEKRTSLDVSPDDSICLAKHFELGFDINLIPSRKVYFGYVLRIVGSGNRNIDLIYNPKLKVFAVIIEDNFSNINFSIDSPRLYREWNHFSLKFNGENNTLQFTVNGKYVGVGNLPAGLNCYRFLWGANDLEKFDTKDVPPMQIKDIRISEEGRLKYYWPLDESIGDTAFDRVGRQMAKVRNPSWIKPKHQQWELLGNFLIKGDAAVGYNPKQDKLYVIGDDSLAIYSLNQEQNPLEWLPSGRLNLRLGNQAVYDTISDRLYDIFVDQHRVVSFDFLHCRWSGNFDSGKITEFWHFNKFISPLDSSLYVIGGYGQLKYKNLIQRYSFATKKCELITATGDNLSPRYLAALGMDPGGKAAYIIGGFGSKTGDQMLRPGNFYDLLKFNFRDRSFKSLYTLRSPATRFTFANSLVIDPKSGEYYGLIYPNDSSNSNLQLVKSTFYDSGLSPLANSIPFSFHDIESFSDLYYSPASNKLLAVVLHYAKIDETARVTEVKIYSVSYPPAPIDIAVPLATSQNGRVLYWALVAFVVCCIGLFLRYWYKRSLAIQRTGNAGAIAASLSEPRLPVDYSYLPDHPDRNARSSIYMFGQFQVFDKDGVDITAQFTPLLKELFLLIATSTLQKQRGISAAGLDEILWHDKADKDARNNRAVNIAKLKALLDKIGPCTINRDSGFWQLQIPDEGMWLDYRQYTTLMRHTSTPSGEYMRSVIDIIRRGAFLHQTEYTWLDTIKSEISNSVINLCLAHIRNQRSGNDPEFTIEICNCIFHFDRLDEDALIYKCKSLIFLKRHTLANITYLNFVKEYKDIYAVDFPKSFQEIIT